MGAFGIDWTYPLLPSISLKIALIDLTTYSMDEEVDVKINPKCDEAIDELLLIMNSEESRAKGYQSNQ